MKTQKLNIRLDDVLKNRLKFICEKIGINYTTFIILSINKYYFDLQKDNVENIVDSLFYS